MNAPHPMFNPSWPSLTRPSIARASASDGVFSAHCSANTPSRASRHAPDGWLPRRAAMTTGRHANACAMRAYADFKCAPGLRIATSGALGNRGGYPSRFFRKQNEQFRCSPHRHGRPGLAPAARRGAARGQGYFPATHTYRRASCSWMAGTGPATTRKRGAGVRPTRFSEVRMGTPGTMGCGKGVATLLQQS